jgi:hypothetical protein
MAQETLEQTQRRLGLSTGPVTNARTARQFSAQVVPTQKPLNARGALRTWAVVGGVVALGILGFNVVQGLAEGGVVGDKWTTYPGSYFVSTDEVLDGPSLEESMADGDGVIEQLQAELAAYGFEWSVSSPGSSYLSSNGYGGDSMLYSYSSDILVGSTTRDDPQAREDIIAIFDTVMSSRPETTVVFSNDEIDGEDAVYFFGSENRDQQALWSAWTYTDAFNGLAVDIDVFDSTVPTEDDFGSTYWVEQDASGTLFVRLRTSASNLLSEDDRAAFIAAVEPYEDETKPDYRG